eukprot:TRINITY_DN5458_c0_g3_i1.p1 TRINITY_DN5458_c0_g3~~TRINITY_DN5458_c0_g3_i1.p1  ORF type:complete len:418 (-),score=18.39 TRINITY_DN5458_c0_g3_i1:115-1368(-)
MDGFSLRSRLGYVAMTPGLDPRSSRNFLFKAAFPRSDHVAIRSFLSNPVFSPLRPSFACEFRADTPARTFGPLPVAYCDAASPPSWQSSTASRPALPFLPPFVRSSFAQAKRDKPQPPTWRQRFDDVRNALVDWNEGPKSVSVLVVRKTPKGVPYSYPKVYDLTLKPLLLAFSWKALLACALRALLQNYLAVAEVYLPLLFLDEDEDNDEAGPPPTPDLVQPAKNSIWTALREIAVSTTRRILERFCVVLVTPRTAHKLIKDYQTSADRKVKRGLAKWQLFRSVCGSTFRSHLLSIVAQWLVQLSIDLSRTAQRLRARRKQLHLAGRKLFALDNLPELTQEGNVLVWRATTGALKGGSALVGASMGAAVGTLLYPGFGTWIGFVLGDMGGPNLYTQVIAPVLPPPPTPPAFPPPPPQ